MAFVDRLPNSSFNLKTVFSSRDPINRDVQFNELGINEHSGNPLYKHIAFDKDIGKSQVLWPNLISPTLITCFV